MQDEIRSGAELAAERREWPWALAVSPTIWAVHFMLCYGTAAIWCAKLADPRDPLWPVRVAIFAFTAVALLAIGVVGYLGYRRHRIGAATLPHDDDTPEDRHRFLGFATLLLSGLSAIAVIYSAMAAVFVETCQ